MRIKDYIPKGDLVNGQNSNASYDANNSIQPQQNTTCLICQGFANIRCTNCNDVWLCIDHWKEHRANRHNSRDGP